MTADNTIKPVAVVRSELAIAANVLRDVGGQSAIAVTVEAGVEAIDALRAEVERLQEEASRAWTQANRANAKVRGWEATLVCTGLPQRLHPIEGWGPGGEGTVSVPSLNPEKLTTILDRLDRAEAEAAALRGLLRQLRDRTRRYMDECGDSDANWASGEPSLGEVIDAAIDAARAAGEVR